MIDLLNMNAYDSAVVSNFNVSFITLVHDILEVLTPHFISTHYTSIFLNKEKDTLLETPLL